MGMAASQARLIELCARKSNVEYEGQQINQQRVNLSNESAGLFNQMMQLAVPTPPSTADYTITTYQFSDGVTEYTIDKISKNISSPEYNSVINYYYNVTNYTGLFKEKNNLDITKRIAPDGKVYYYYGTTQLANYNGKEDDAALTQISKDLPDSWVARNFVATSNVQEEKDPTTGNTIKTITNTEDPTNYTKQTLDENGVIRTIYTHKMDAGKEIETTITYDPITGEPSYERKEDGVVTSNDEKDMLDSVPIDYYMRDKIKSYTQGSQTYYISLDQYDEKSGKTKQPVQACYACDYTTKQYSSTEAYLEHSDSGRYTSVTLPGFSASMPLEVTTYTDENAYNDAMQEYSYQQQLYEKKVQEINAKTEIIQQEDRTLELKLKQLDTEHNALQTEMDAVKKVIDKNIESTFKTFS